jgi:AbrB family looped-hinge helix DNA binding protein
MGAIAYAKLSSGNQIVLPREAREALGVKAGDQLLVVVHGERLIVIELKAHHRAIRGMRKGLYLAKERKSWD